MPEQAVCKCGRAYAAQDYLLRDDAKCPNCAQELCLATCACGKPLTVAHRQENHPFILRSFVDFKCPECGREATVHLESRKRRPVYALVTAIVFAVLFGGGAWWAGARVEFAFLAGLVGAILGAAAFYFRLGY